MDFDKILVNDKQDLLHYRAQIFQLFKDCFDEEMNNDLWAWAYMENPFGDPIVSLWFYQGQLAGHYAVVPYHLRKGKEREVRALLSMTTMVGPQYRRQGLFVAQAEEVYKEAKKLNYEFVFGFPNNNSAPGFKKRLQWEVEGFQLLQLKKSELTQLNLQYRNNLICADVGNENFLRWRVANPNNHYRKCNGVITKQYGRSYDIMFQRGDFSMLDDNSIYNILLTQEEASDFANHLVIFEYKFGFRVIKYDDLKLDDFKLDLIMSDVF